jgi:hypothetical protein
MLLGKISIVLTVFIFKCVPDQDSRVWTDQFFESVTHCLHKAKDALNHLLVILKLENLVI